MNTPRIVTLEGVDYWKAQPMWHTPEATWLREAEGPDDGDGFVVVIDDDCLIERLNGAVSEE